MSDVFDMAKDILGISTDELLPEENSILTDVQAKRFNDIMVNEMKARRHCTRSEGCVKE